MKRQARGQGFMQAGLSLLSSMRPTALPQSPFANLGQAGMEGLQAYQGNLNNKMAQALEYAKMQKALQPQTEFNTPGDLDTFLAGVAGKFNQDYSMPQGRMAMLKLFGDQSNGLRDEFQKWKTSIAPQLFNQIPTSEGYVPANVRTGVIGKSVSVEKPLSPEMIVAQQQIGTLKDTLTRVREDYKPEYVGFAAGRLGSLKENTVGVPAPQASFYSNLEQTKNSLIYLMSGKQINESEYNRLLKQLPDRNLPAGVFETRMKEFDRTLDSIIAERSKASGGYGVPKPQQKQKAAAPLGGSKFKIISVE
jgi:hypothetical protein